MTRQLIAVNTGDRFGRLEVIGIAFKKRGGIYFTVSCDCGILTTVRKDCLYTGRQKSCGCFKREATATRFRTHGLAGVKRPPEYDCWAHMLRRCYTPSTREFKNYGARGIEVCSRWINSFENFLADMGQRPTSKHSLDRINNNGNYEPTNCRWTTQIVQSNNTRSNHNLTVGGKTQSLRQWEREKGFSRNTLYTRLKNGWTPEDAVNTAVNTQFRNHRFR